MYDLIEQAMDFTSYFLVGVMLLVLWGFVLALVAAILAYIWTFVFE